MTPEEKQEKHTRFVADLRALADLFEREPTLPLPYLMDGTGYPAHEHGDNEERVAAVFAAAELLGTTVEHDRVNGILTTRLKTGHVQYSVYVKVGTRPTPSDRVTVSSPAEVLGTEAVSV